MALYTEESIFASQKHHAADRTVRRMARNAAFDFHRSMFEDIWAAFLRVACDAGFPVRFAQHRLIPSAVCVVTVGTFHQTFGDLMVVGKRELSLHNLVACETEVRLRLA